MTDAEASALLKSLYPPHAFDWLEAETGDGGIGDLLDALGEEANDDGFELVAQLEKERSPVTSDASLDDREATMGIERSKIALYGSKDQRRAQLLARFRESGTPTPDRILSALHAICGPVAVQIVEHRRSLLRAVNTHSMSTLTATVGNTSSIDLFIGDNAPTSQAGVRITLNVSTGDAGVFAVVLTTPDGTPLDVTGVIVDGGDHDYCFPTYDGPCSGAWRLAVSNTAGTTDVQVDTANIFVEGIGRPVFGGPDGLGANIFEWSALVNEAVAASTYDRDTVRNLVQRWNPAHCRAFLALFATTGSAGAIFDDTSSIFDGCLFS